MSTLTLVGRHGGLNGGQHGRVPGAPQATQGGLHESFVGLRARLRPMVQRIIGRGQVDDPEALEAEVWLRVWRRYPAMARREERLHSVGLPGHRWRNWVSRLAHRLVLDDARRRDVARRALGVRAFAVRSAAAGDSVAEEWDALLEPDETEDTGELSDPARWTEERWQREALARALRRLPRVEAEVMRRRQHGDPLRRVAADMGLTVYAVREAEARALVALRRAVGAERPRRPA